MEQLKKRKKVLSAFCIFLALMWLCTLVSKSIYASKLPQVVTKTPQRMVINHNVKAEGIVTEGRQLAVNTQAGMRVHTVYAHVGDKVTPDTLLFDLDLEDLSDVIQEKEIDIKKLQLQINDLAENKALANTSRQKGIDRAKQDLSLGLGAADQTIARANEDLEKAQSALREHREHHADVTPDAQRDAAWEAYEAWVVEGQRLSQAAADAKTAYEQALKDQAVKEGILEALRKEAQEQEPGEDQEPGQGGQGQEPGENKEPEQGGEPEQNGEPEGGQGQEPGENKEPEQGGEPEQNGEPEGARGQEPGENKEPEQGGEPEQNGEPEGARGQEPGENKEPEQGGEPEQNGEPEGARGQEPGENKKAGEAGAPEENGGAKPDPQAEGQADGSEGRSQAEKRIPGSVLESGSFRLPVYRSETENKNYHVLRAASELAEAIRQAEKDLELAKEKTAAAKEAMDSAQAALEKHMANAVKQPDFSGEDAARSAWASTEDALKSAVNNAERTVQDSYRAKDNANLQGTRQLEDASVPSGADSSLEIQQLELKKMQKELQDYKKIRDAGGKVYAEAEGVVTGIRVASGERTGDGAAVTYADLTSPMQFLVNLTREQKKYVNQDDPVSIRFSSRSQESYNIDYIAESDTSPGSFQAVVNLQEGVGTIGQSGTLEVSAQSETFNCCIPLEALYEESGRNYVYAVGKKDSILGEELAAEKIYVTVLDKNEHYAAIEEGVIDSDTELIVSATEPVADRDVIRYKE